MIIQNAERTGLDAEILAALILHESRGDQNAISHQGAVGLMQIMPRDGIASGFQCINGPCFAGRPTTNELLNPTYNIEYGSNYLAGLVNKFGLRDGLFSYGPSGVGYTYADNIIETAERIKNGE